MTIKQWKQQTDKRWKNLIFLQKTSRFSIFQQLVPCGKIKKFPIEEKMQSTPQKNPIICKLFHKNPPFSSSLSTLFQKFKQRKSIAK